MKKPTLKKLWEKNFKDIGLEIYLLGDYRIALALDARRIIIGAFNELNFLDFNGKKERTMKTDNRRLISARSDRTISRLIVSSDCSKIILLAPDRFGVKSPIIFNQGGAVESEFNLPGTLNISLDGRLFVRSSKEELEVCDWRGNRLFFLSDYDPFGLKAITMQNIEFRRKYALL